jgi:hypothetical protein
MAQFFGCALFAIAWPFALTRIIGWRRGVRRSWYYLILAAIDLILSVWLMVGGRDVPAGLGIMTGAVVLVYLSWRDSDDRRNRRGSRARSRVFNLGHRLVVAPAEGR